MLWFEKQTAERPGSGNGYSGRRYFEIKEAASLWFCGMGSAACGRGFQTEMYGMRTSDHDRTQAGGEEYQKNTAEIFRR